jgi:hypothetical protein
MERPELTHEQQMKFLELVSKVSSPVLFRRQLDMNAADVEYYKKQLDLDSHEDARIMLRRLRNDATRREEVIPVDHNSIREAEDLANQRLRELEAARAKKRDENRPVIDQAAIAEEDAERQRRLDAQNEEVETPDRPWELPLSGNSAQRDEQIDRFRKDIQYRGLSFCCTKYDTNSKAIRAEAARLDININWGTVRR